MTGADGASGAADLRLPPHLRRPVALTRAGMLAERVVRRFWPFWTVLAASLVPLLMGWHDLAPVELVWGYLVVAVLGLVASLVWGLRGLALPGRAEALARVDASLPGRPISALADTQAVGAGDAASEAVWRAHLLRMEARTRTARAVEPDLRVADRDPFGLRFIALLFLVAALLFGSVWRVGSVAEMTPGGGAALASGPVWEGWIEPPAHTGRPSLYLADLPQGDLAVPAGSRLTLRLYGEVGALRVAESVSGREGTPEDAAAPAQSFDIVAPGRLAIEGPDPAVWDIRLIADAPPTIALDGAVVTDAMGQMAQPFAAADDYGVTGGTATITLDLAAVERVHGLATEPDRRPPLVIDLPLPFSGDRTDFDESLIENLSEHPFANLPVTMTLMAEDAIGQVGYAVPERMVLPGRRFFQPMARAVIEQRRDLLWSRDNALRVLQVLRAVSHRPEDIFTNDTTYLRLNITLRRLASLTGDGLTEEEQDEIAQALWELAIQLEDGTLADARERLQRAQDRLAEAMRDGASDEEIAELMDELRQAMDDYMRMLAENAQPGDGTDQPQSSDDTMTVTRDELQALMDRIQELMEEGRMAEAAELMEQLNQMMENMQAMQGQGGEGQPSPGQQSMQDLAETLRDQQGLSDDAFRDLQDQFNPGQQGEQGGQPGQQGQQGQQGEGQRQGQGLGQGGDAQDGQQGGDGQGGEGEEGSQGGPEGLAERQQALRDELNRQRDNLPGLGGEAAEEARRSLERAEGAMDGAEQALRADDLAEAIDRQAEAMDALREGLRNLGEALAEDQQQQQGQGQQQAGEGQGRAEPMRRDPLGRQLGDSGQLGSDESMLPGEDVQRRAEELLGEIRRRSGDQSRPEIELDYLRRLLERF